MLKTIKTFNAHAINDNISYRVVAYNSNNSPSADLAFLPEARADSIDSGTFTVQPRSLFISIKIVNYANRLALADQLQVWMLRGTAGPLVAAFLDDGLDYQLSCRVVNLVQDDELQFTVVLQSGNTDWRAVTADTDAWDVTSTGGSHAITVAGTDMTRLSLVLTATAGPSLGYLYQNMVQLLNVPGVTYPTRPWCITLDTAALVTAGKMQADCDDLRVFVDSRETNRWIADPNTNHTHIWFNSNLAAGFALNTAVAIASSGAISYITFVKNATNLAKLKKLPASGILVDGTEWIAYSAPDLTNYRVTVLQRGVLGTTLQAHTAGSVFNYMEHVVTLYYGNSAATSPALDDDNYDALKPTGFNLSTSDNTKRVADNTIPFHNDWTPVVTRKGTESWTYTVKQNAASGDPALGANAAAYLKGTAWQPDAITLGWKYYNPGGIYRITCTGQRYRSGAKWPAFAGLKSSPNGSAWAVVFSEVAPTVAAAFQAWATHSLVAITNTTQYLLMAFVGVSDNAASSYELLEMLTYTIEFTAAGIPALTLIGERANYTLSVRVQNDSLAPVPSFDLVYQMQLNKAFTLDGENYLANYNNVNAHGAMDLDDPSRSVWIPLKVGTNTITVSSPDAGTLHLVASWYRRRL